jgi:D-sedoheptulose 7-phosphate isomerase
VIGISTSGNSPNVLRAIELAKRFEATTIGFTGFDSGQLGSMVDIDLHIPSSIIEHVEDLHLVLEHLICKALRERPSLSAMAEDALPVMPDVLFERDVQGLD